MKKTPKSKAERQVWRSGKAYPVALDYQTPVEKAVASDIISRMEEAQQRFNPFPSLLVSAENERRLQLNDREERTFDAEDAEEWQRQSERQGVE